MQLAEKNNTKIVFDIDYRAYNWKSKDEIAVKQSIMSLPSNIPYINAEP